MWGYLYVYVSEHEPPTKFPKRCFTAPALAEFEAAIRARAYQLKASESDSL